MAARESRLLAPSKTLRESDADARATVDDALAALKPFNKIDGAWCEAKRQKVINWYHNVEPSKWECQKIEIAEFWTEDRARERLRAQIEAVAATYRGLIAPDRKRRKTPAPSEVKAQLRNAAARFAAAARALDELNDVAVAFVLSDQNNFPDHLFVPEPDRLSESQREAIRLATEKTKAGSRERRAVEEFEKRLREGARIGAETAKASLADEHGPLVLRSSPRYLALLRTVFGKSLNAASRNDAGMFPFLLVDQRKLLRKTIRARNRAARAADLAKAKHLRIAEDGVLERMRDSADRKRAVIDPFTQQVAAARELFSLVAGEYERLLSQSPKGAGRSAALEREPPGEWLVRQCCDIIEACSDNESAAAIDLEGPSFLKFVRNLSEYATGQKPKPSAFLRAAQAVCAGSFGTIKIDPSGNVTID